MLFWRWFRGIIVCLPHTSDFIYAPTVCSGSSSFRGGVKKALSDNKERDDNKKHMRLAPIYDD